LNHSLNQYHIAAARGVTFSTLRAGVSANRATPKADTHVVALQNWYLPGLLGRNGASPMADRQSRLMIHLMKTAGLFMDNLHYP
jgi:hypothetical protein